MDSKSQTQLLNEADLTRRAQRLRAEAFAGWMRGLRQRIGGRSAR